MAGEPIDLRVLRPEDLLVLNVSLRNLSVGDDGLLHVVDPQTPGRIVFQLPSQHIAEQAFLENETSSEAVSPVPVRSAAAAPSRLAFDVPADGPGVPFTVAGLLEWSALRPALARNALPAGTPTTAGGVRPAEPADDVTALELAYRLVLSPIGDHGWLHRKEPHTATGATELWHTQLTGTDFRAIFGRATDPFHTSLLTTDIGDLVTLTGDFGNAVKSARQLGMPIFLWLFRTRRLSPLGRPIVPPPSTLTADHVILTPLGASLHVLGKFDFPRDDQRPDDLKTLGVTPPSVQAYEHITGLGRDQYVKVVKRGYFDTGHRGAVVKVTERRFEPVSLGTEPGPQGPVGVFGTRTVLRQYYRIIVTQPFLDYGTLAAGYPHARREMPLRTIELRTLETPKIDLEGISFKEGGTQAQVDAALDHPFWVKVSGQLFPFDFDGLDGEERRVSMTKPMLFIPYSSVGDTDGVVSTFNIAPPASRRAAVRGQRLALTEPDAGRPDASSAPTEYLLFDLVKVTNDLGMPRDYVPGWLPQAVTAAVHIHSVEQLTGSPKAVEVRLATTYLDHGFDPGANPACLFASYPELPLTLGAAVGGGVAAPAVQLDALSTVHGAMPSTMAAGVDGAMLKSLLAGMKLFGTVELADLLGPIPPAQPVSPGEDDDDSLDRALADATTRIRVPVIRTRAMRDASGSTVGSFTRLAWKPDLLPHPPVKPAFELGKAQFALDVQIVTRPDDSPKTTVAGRLSGFSLTLAGVVRLSMGTLKFVSKPGSKPDITAEEVGLQFVGPLAFVDTIRQLLPADGFSDPPAITTTPEGMQAGFSLGIPTAGVGAFSLQNLSLSAAISLPFIGKPAGLRFALSSREHPFLVTVTLFGGGGFFALGVSAAGVEEVEAAIEFGGNVSLNLGVASGGVYVMAGVYFKLSASKGTELTGYFRCGGYLEVLGLISVSLEFYLAFTYRDKGGDRNEIWGQATLTVSVKVLCFSTSVRLSVEKRFAGPAGDPTLDQVLSPDDWQAYCLAYGAEPAS